MKCFFVLELFFCLSIAPTFLILLVMMLLQICAHFDPFMSRSNCRNFPAMLQPHRRNGPATRSTAADVLAACS